MTNDKLIALRTSYWFKDPKRGDIIIFKYPEDEREWYTKRKSKQGEKHADDALLY